MPIPITLGGHFRRHLRVYLAGALMLALFQLAMNRIDWLSKQAIDLIFGSEPGLAWLPATMMLGLALFAFVARVASRWFVFNAGRDVEFELRTVLLERLHKLGAAFYRTMSPGEIMSRATNDLQQVRMLFGFGILNLINVVFAFASALQVMLSVSVVLSLACMTNLPLLVLFSRAMSRGLFLRMRENQASLGKLSDMLQGNLAGVRVVRSFAFEDREQDRFELSNRRYLNASLSLARLRGSLGPLAGATSAVGILVFFWYGASLLLRSPTDGGISQGQFFAFWLSFARMTWPMLALGFSLSIVQRGRAGYARLRDVFLAEPEVVDGPLPAPKSLSGALSVRSLSFAYGTRTVLNQVSFELPQGKSLAVVGRTGSGKTTLALLLARLLPTPRETVFIDGLDVCDLPVSSVRGVIGVAQQDAFLFSTTVARNVGFALEDPDSPEALVTIMEAAREAQVLEESLALPEAFDTVVGERGVQLSGGQKQRVALARALAWRPRILVLDDPLSAVDAKTEAAILEAIERQAASRTVVLITHRVAAASRCESIVVLEQGQVVERGTHAELVRAGGLYADFAEEQQMASELDDLRDEPPTVAA